MVPVMPHKSSVAGCCGIIRVLLLRIQLLLFVGYLGINNNMVLFSLTVSGVARQAAAFHPRPALWKRLQPLLSTRQAASASTTAVSSTTATTTTSSTSAVDHVPPPVPMTLLSGFLGTGKTTTLKHLLENTLGLKIGVVVNDVASVNIDAKLVASDSNGDMVELQNGCACCSIADELFTSVERLCQNRKLDAFVVECKCWSITKILRSQRID